MANRTAYFLSQHPETDFYLMEIGEQALKLSGFEIHSFGDRREFSRSSPSLPSPHLVLVDWDFRLFENAHAYPTSSRFNFLPHATNAYMPIIAMSRTHHTPDEAQKNGAHTFVWAELRYALDDSRYITGNAAILAERLDPVIKKLKIGPSPSPEIIRYGILQKRPSVPDLYKNFTGFAPPVRPIVPDKKVETNPEPAGSKTAPATPSSSAGSIGRRRHGGTYDRRDIFQGSFLARRVEKKIADRLAAEADATDKSPDSEAVQQLQADEPSRRVPVLQSVLAARRYRLL